jgi:hypothetical protein
MDQGGLAAIAGVILWVLTAMVGAFFVQPAPSKKDKRSTKAKTKERTELRTRQLQLLKGLEQLEQEKRLQKWAQQGSSVSTDCQSTSSRNMSLGTASASPKSSPNRSPPGKSLQNDVPHSSPPNSTKRASTSDDFRSKRSRIRSDIEAIANITQEKTQLQNEEVEVAIRSSLESPNRTPDEPETSRVRREKSCKDDRKSIEEELEIAAKEAGLSEPTEDAKHSGAKASQRWRRGTIVESPKKVEANESSYNLPISLTRDVSDVVDQRAFTQDGGLEVYISKTLDNIDSMIDEENPYHDPYWYEV